MLLLERIIILSVLALLFWWAMVWISPKKTPEEKKKEQKVHGWGEMGDKDGYDDYCPMTLSAGHGGT